MRNSTFFILFTALFCAGSLLPVHCPAARALVLPPPGHFLSIAAVDKQEAQSHCIVDPHSDIAPMNLPCRVTKFSSIGADENGEYFAAWNHRPAKSARPEDAGTEQVVLFRQAVGGEQLLAVWTDVVDLYGDQPAMTKMRIYRAQPGLIFEVEYISGGTGAPWKEYFLRQKESWTYLKQAFDQDAAKCLPKGYGIQLLQANLDTMTAEAFAPNDNDPLCCPSGKISLHLQLKADVLRGTQCSFEKVVKKSA
jgi:hypothetical protein